ncbi:C39 family peptidase [Microcoleus sp. D2_18a_B4]|uniref:C39 family peptidase n=1 Tax=Microcoleus sp. D2_18a_B4 TaxID=3055329 RepID=UPI002FD14839
MNDKLKSTRNSVRLSVPYKMQLDNKFEPYSTCNVTSLAMCLEYYEVGLVSTFGGMVRENKNIQLEDELYQYMSDKGLNKHYPEDLAQVARRYGIRDDFTVRGTFDGCKQHLKSGNPCIVHGYFTGPGHIIVLVGYDDKGFLVHDPYGEWFQTGYRTDLSGEYLHYSYDLIQKTCAYDSQFWVHYLSK